MAEDLKSKLAAINAAKAERAKKQEAETKLNAEVGEAQEEAGKENTLRDKAKALEAKVGDAEQGAKEAEDAIQQAEGMLAEGGLEAEEQSAIEGIKAEAHQKIEELNNTRAELADIKAQIEQLNTKPEATAEPKAENVGAEEAPQKPLEAVVAEEPQVDAGMSSVEIQANKPEPTPEDSAKALSELSYNMIHSATSVEGHIQGDFSVDGFIQKNSERTRKVEELQKTLKSFESKSPSALSASEKSQLSQALAEANGQTYYSIHGPGNSGPYKEDSPTALDHINRNLDYSVKIDQGSVEEIQAEVAVLKGEATPDRVGRVDLVKMKEKLDLLTEADKQGLLENLQGAIQKAQEGIQKARGIIKKNGEALKQSEPVLRASERTLHNTLLDLDQMTQNLRKQFASVL